MESFLPENKKFISQLTRRMAPVLEPNIAIAKSAYIDQECEEEADEKREQLEPAEVVFDLPIDDDASGAEEGEQGEKHQRPCPKGHLLFGNPVLKNQYGAVPF